MSFMERDVAFAGPGIQELSLNEVDEVSGGIPLVFAAYMAFHGARTAYAIGAAGGFGVTMAHFFD